MKPAPPSSQPFLSSPSSSSNSDNSNGGLTTKTHQPQPPPRPQRYAHHTRPRSSRLCLTRGAGCSVTRRTSLSWSRVHLLCYLVSACLVSVSFLLSVLFVTQRCFTTGDDQPLGIFPTLASSLPLLRGGVAGRSDDRSGSSNIQLTADLARHEVSDGDAFGPARTPLTVPRHFQTRLLNSLKLTAFPHLGPSSPSATAALSRISSLAGSPLHRRDEDDDGYATAQHGTTLLHHTRADRKGFRGEHLLHFSPLCLTRSMNKNKSSLTPSSVSLHVALSPERPLLCTDFARNATIPREQCEQFHARMAKEHGPFHRGALHHMTKWPADLVWVENRTTLFIPLITRDLNVCHALMRFLFAWNLLRSSRMLQRRVDINHSRNSVNMSQNSSSTTTTVLPGFKDPPLIVLLAPHAHIERKFSSHQSKEAKVAITFGNERWLPFQVGLLHYLFQRWGADILVTKSLNNLLPASSLTRSATLKHSTPSKNVGINSGTGSVCFQHASVPLSHSNRFSFPDVELGANVLPTSIRKPLPYPLSSNAFALRSAVFAPGRPPRRVHKLVYVQRLVGGRRSFDGASERKLVRLLTRVTKEFGFAVAIHSAPPRRAVGRPFFKQVELFADAAIVFGLHGAGLSLAAFAPRGCTIVEVKTREWWVPLFGRLASSGKSYVVIPIGHNTTGIGNDTVVAATGRGEREGSEDAIKMRQQQKRMMKHIGQQDLDEIERVVRREVWLASQG